jgi:threonine dehydrogenase-like Zn-dependent dehydrogenase
MGVRAITVEPLKAGSESLEERDGPVGDGDLVVDAIALGICGTDAEIVRGDYGWAPPGATRLVLGHESLGRVAEAPEGSDFAAGDLVVGVVRRPDPEPCAYCARGEWDRCLNGKYTERGIKERDGYGAERWHVEKEFAVKLDASLGLHGVLMEPTSVVAKAWERVERATADAIEGPRRVLVTGAGPIGLLAAMLASQRGHEVHVLDRATGGPKPDLVKRLGATFHAGSVTDVDPEPDVVIEATGVGQVVLDAMARTGPNGVVCLTGVSSGGRKLELDAGELNRSMVLQNDMVIGSVNANLRHYHAAAEALAKADPEWLDDVIARRVPLEKWAEALEHRDTDVKTVVLFNEG